MSAVVGDVDQMRRVLMGLPSVSVELVIPFGVLTGERGTVAELGDLGFITGEHARELILHAGEERTTIHRLLTDPVDGRCVERTRRAYRPDQAMLDQLRAADGTCRAPGCTIPSSRSDLDHERPYDHDDPTRGGPTSETNLNHKHRYHHWAKTERLWSTAMDALTRRVTWTSLFGQCYRTSPKDYRPLADRRTGGTHDGGCDHDHPGLVEELACRRRRRSEQGRRDQLRRTSLQQAGIVTRYYEQRWVASVHDLLDRMYYENAPDEVLPEAVTPSSGSATHDTLPVAAVLYAAIAEQQSCQDLLQHPDLDVADTVPVELAHLRGSQVRRGPRRGLPDLAQLLAGRASQTPLEPPPVDPDEPPPF